MSQITISSMEDVRQNPKILADKLSKTLDKENKVLEEYFSYLQNNNARFDDYLTMLEKFIIPQLNEKYEGNEKKYGSKDKWDDYRNGLLFLFLDVDDYVRENYLLGSSDLRKEYAKFIDKVDPEIKNQLDKKRFCCANAYMLNKLNTEPDGRKEVLKEYFSYLQSDDARFDNYLTMLGKFIVPQLNEKYEGNEKKYDSEEKYEKYQKELFDVLVEVNDFLWENYLFLDRELRWEYADDVISKINIDCFERFLYAEKDEVKKSKDKKKMEVYNQTLENFFYRNIRSLIFSKLLCKNLRKAILNADDSVPNDIDPYLDTDSNQTTSWLDEAPVTQENINIFKLNKKLDSFKWKEKLDENNKMARECLADIKKIEYEQTNLFDVYISFFETAVIPQVNESEYEEKYTPKGWPPYNSLSDEKKAEFVKLQREIYDKHQNQLLDILVETNDLIWQILESNSLSEYEKNKLLAHYYNLIKKIKPSAWEKIGELLDKRKEEAIKSRDKDKVTAYNKLVKNFIYRNLENETISVSNLHWMGVPNLINEKTFEEYTGDSMIEKLFAYSAIQESKLGDAVVCRSTIKIRKSDKDKDKKICLESKCGNFMSGTHCQMADTILGRIRNSSDDIDFSFSSLNQEEIESNPQIKNFYLNFRPVYNNLKKNNFIVDISGHAGSNRTRDFMYLGSWIVPFFPKDVDFDTVYTELSKRLDFLCDSHYDLPKQKIDQKQKDKLIIQTLVYATNSLCLLTDCNEKSVYRTLMMITGEEKFVEGHKFSLEDIKKILSIAKNSVLAPMKVLKFCKDCRAEDVLLFDILKLAKNMGISVSGSQSTGRDVCLKDDRNARLGITSYRSIPYNLFNKNDFWTYMSESPKNLEEKEFDTWFSFFLTNPILPEKRTSDENEKIREFFIQVIDKIPAEYLQLKKFISLINYFANHNTANAINLNFNEFNNLISKMNKQMGKEDFETFEEITMKYCTISGRKISDQDIEDAYNNVKNPADLAFENEDIDTKSISNNETINENNNQNDNMDAADPVYLNINKVELEGYNDLSSDEQKNKNVNSVEDMDINKGGIENENNNQSTAKPIYQNINEVEPKDSMENPMNNNQNKNNSAYNIEIAQIEDKIKELKDRRVRLEVQISDIKSTARELSDRNWLVRKFLGIFYCILGLVKNNALQKVDMQLNKLQNQLKEMGSTDQTDISDRISYPRATEQTIPDMQRDGIVPNQNK